MPEKEEASPPELVGREEVVGFEVGRLLLFTGLVRCSARRFFIFLQSWIISCFFHS